MMPGMTTNVKNRHPLLQNLGERTRHLRARRGMTRKALAAAADISERHLANLELGDGNVSVLLLHQLAQALQCPLAELLGDPTTQSAEWLLLRELLRQADDATVRTARLAAAQALGHGSDEASTRIALIGLRGAGKSTLGQRLADALGYPFIELSQRIEALAGCSVSEIQALYGVSAYRRYEHRALEDAISQQTHMVLATPGGVVSNPASFGLLLDKCTTVWLRASPEDHMARVTAQGDLRPMAASQEAMEDLKAILAGREAFYAQANLHLDTSAQPLEASFHQLRQALEQTIPQLGA